MAGIMSSHSLRVLIPSIIVLTLLPCVCGFLVRPVPFASGLRRALDRHGEPARSRAGDQLPASAGSDPEPSSGQPPSYRSTYDAFPVLSRISGIDWVGECRYADSDLKAAPFKLRGGTRYDLDGDACTLTSFLSFPNGKMRQVQMKGTRGEEEGIIRLDPVSEDGPIYMVLMELAPDSVLLKEIDKVSGSVVLTASLSIVNGGEELVQVSHEIGGLGAENPVEGHQVWRLKKFVEGGGPDDIGAFRDTTGR